MNYNSVIIYCKTRTNDLDYMHMKILFRTWHITNGYTKIVLLIEIPLHESRFHHLKQVLLGV